MPTITPLPSPPSTSDPANFSSKADAHILALQTFTTEVNAFGASLAGAGIITPTRDSFAVNATTTDLWNHSIVQDWTGTATVTNFPAAPAAGSQRVAYPASGTIITDNANIDVQGNASYTIVAGDELTITAITTTTFYVTIKRKDGKPVIPNAFADLTSKPTTLAGYGITDGAGTPATPINTTSGSSLGWSGLPAGLNKIKLKLNYVSATSAATLSIRIGNGSIISAGYDSRRMAVVNGGVSSSSNFTDAIAQVIAGAASTLVIGEVEIERLTGNTWIATSNIYRTVDAIADFSWGLITLAGDLDRVFLETSAGTFDAGSMNLRYQ